MVQLSYLYMTTGKTITLARWTLVCKLISLLFNMLSRFVIVFLPRSNCLLILWQSPSSVILEFKKIKSPTVSTFSPPICHEVMGPGAAMILIFWMLSFKLTLKVIKENRFPPPWEVKVGLEVYCQDKVTVMKDIVLHLLTHTQASNSVVINGCWIPKGSCVCVSEGGRARLSGVLSPGSLM